MEQLDQQAVNLTKAIRQVESGGDFNATSKDGSFGAYQFLKPTWDAAAKKFGVNVPWQAATPSQQNEVAYKQVKDWKDKGYNVGQIASMWNAGSGRPDAYKQGLAGTNASGVNYNVASYAKKVADTYHQIKGGASMPKMSQGTASTPSPQPDQTNNEPIGTKVILNGIPEIPAPFKSNEGDSAAATAAKTLGNLPTDAVNLGTGIINFLNPVKNINDIIKNVTGTYQALKDESKRTGENPLAILGKSLVSMTPDEKANPVTGKKGATSDLASSALHVLLPQFLQQIGTGDFAGATKTLAEHPATSIGPLVLVASGIAEKAGVGAEFDAAMKKVASPVTEGLPKLAEPIMPKGKAPAEAFQKATNQTFQPKTPYEAVVASKVAANVDFSPLPKNPTYSQLSDFLQKEIDTKQAKVNKNLGNYNETYKPADLQKKVTGEGGSTAKVNYAQEAINGLKSLYKTIKDPESLVKVRDLEKKFKDQGLSSKELNDLAKQYGSEFGKKAFGKMGEPLTGTGAQTYETIRSGVKENARGTLPNDEARALDKNTSSLIKAKDMSDRMASKVDQLSNRIVERRIGEKIGRTLGIVGDWATLGTVKGFVAKLFPSNVGLKTLNSLDLEARLGKNLKTIEKLTNAPDSVILKTLKKINESPGKVVPVGNSSESRQ